MRSRSDRLFTKAVAHAQHHMFRRAFSRAASAVGLGLITLSCSSESAPESAPVPAPATSSTKPSIILIYAEDITTLISAYGDRSVKTPNIDQLVREGIRYTHAFQAAGVGSPSRAAMITGMYPTSIGAQHMWTAEVENRGAAATTARPMPDGLPYCSIVPPPAVKPFPEYLRRAGYYATNNLETDYQFEAPVTTWDENGPAASYLYRPIGAPFFASFTLFATHESMLVLGKEPLAIDPARLVVPPILPDTSRDSCRPRAPVHQHRHHGPPSWRADRNAEERRCLRLERDLLHGRQWRHRAVVHARSARSRHACAIDRPPAAR